MREPQVHRASRIGSFAADIIGGGGEADVIAVFERSFYLLCAKGIVAVCQEALGAGPINSLVPVHGSEAPWHGLVRDGMKADITAGLITTAGGFSLDVDAAAEWSPPPWAPWNPALAALGLQQIHHHISALPVLLDTESRTESGLAPLVFAPTSPAARSATASAARQQIQTLRDALPDAMAVQQWPSAARQAATLLIGLGPGLTPSGDDLIGGLMLALTARGELTLRDALWDHIVDELNDLTVPVSAMHLTAAAHGQGHETVHTLLNAILANDHSTLPSALRAVAGLGATSGLDTVAGLVLGMAAPGR